MTAALIERVEDAVGVLYRNCDIRFGAKSDAARKDAGEALAELVTTLNRAALVAELMFMMIDRETWRRSGADDGQGHYEGDYRAEQTLTEIRSWAVSR